jgi:hypothetical protein
VHARFLGHEEAQAAVETAPVVGEVAVGEGAAAAEVGDVGPEQDAVGSGAATEGQRLEEPHGRGMVPTAQLLYGMVHNPAKIASVRAERVGGVAPQGGGGPRA